MNRSAFLMFAAVISIVYGIGNVLMPAWVNEVHGLTSSPSTSLISRFFGASLLGLGVIVWLARNAAESDALSAIMRGGLVVAVAGLVVSVHAMMAGLMNTIGWIPVIIQALLTLGFVYFALIKR